MIPYLLLIALPAAFSFLPADKNSFLQKFLLIFAGITYILFIGLRDEVGADWFAYILIFDFIHWNPIEEGLLYTEPAYALLNWLSAQANMDIYGSNVVIAILFVSGLIKLAEKMPNPWLALISVTPYLVIAVGMSGVRQAAAIGIIFHLIAGWRKSSFYKNITLASIATCFHYSAFVAVFFVIQNMKMPIWLRWIILLIGAVISVIIFTGTEKYSTYEEVYIIQNLYSPGALQHVALNAIPATIYLIFIKYWQDVYGKSDLMKWLSYLSLLSVIGVFFYSTAIDRLALYLSPIQMLVYSSIPVVFKSQIYAIGIILLHFAILFIWLNYSNTAFAFLPYRNLLF